jgi:hypothetical protein
MPGCARLLKNSAEPGDDAAGGEGVGFQGGFGGGHYCRVLLQGI